MDAALIEILRDIPKEEINRVLQADGFSRWTYFTDAEAGQAGILYANNHSLAMYHTDSENQLKLGPLGVLKLRSLEYVPSEQQLYLVRSGQYSTLQVFNDPAHAGQDAAAAQQWQQFLAEHSVRKMTASTGSPAPSSGLYKKVGFAAATAAAVIAVVAFVAVK